VRKKRLEIFSKSLVVAANFSQKGIALVRLACKHRVEQTLELLPAFGRHKPSFLLISR
jgi:hypothetical protein